MNANHKTNITIGAMLGAVVVSLFFLLVTVTALFVVAWLFALIGIAALWFGAVYMVEHAKSYPWFAAFPATLGRYLIVELIFSALFVILEQTGAYILPIAWFVVLHLVLLAGFAAFALLLKGGKETIELRDQEAKTKVFEWKSLVADVQSIRENAPQFAGQIGPVVDALRYSDPMSNPALTAYDDAVKNSVILLEQAAAHGDAAVVGELCVTLQWQIKDRNNRVKLLK